MSRQVATDLIDWPYGDTGARVLGASERGRGRFASAALHSLETVYRGAIAARNFSFDMGLRPVHHAAMPLISIGNIVAGGAGKTPIARRVVRDLVERGLKVAVLHGGYGSDEPALHRRWAPEAIVIEEKDRVAAAAAAFEQGADIGVLDDAFQHRRLARDLDIVLVPVETPSHHLLPCGPLREPEHAISRADLIIITRKTADAETARRHADRILSDYGRPVAVVALLPEDDVAPDGPVAVIAAIARPDLLVAQLRTRGVEVAKVIAYPDHHEYTPEDAEYIRAATDGLPIVTTEKDAIKLGAVFAASDLMVLKQKIEFEEGEALLRQMVDRIL